MSRIHHPPNLLAAISPLALLIGLAGAPLGADETQPPTKFDELPIEFHNLDVKLSGSLLLPKSAAPVPAVLFNHGAGHHTRESLREVAEHFANHGIAALIYDKRGVGQSTGEHQSFGPYENLINDALAGVAFLKERPEIEPSQIGLWGLSQGAYVSAAAAARSDDVQFVVGAGASVCQGMKTFYRDHLFRRYKLSDTLRDVAEKLQMGMETLPHNLSNESLLSTFAPRAYPAPEDFVHPQWSRVHQPVLVMWGQLDQHQPVGESFVGLKNSLAQAGNKQWTIVILPQANHDLGFSETGELHRPWRGYAPGALQTMTDWVHRVIDDPAQLDTMQQIGSPPPISDVLATRVRYERLRWFGNGIVQVALWLLFISCFLANTIAGIRYCFLRMLHQSAGETSPPSSKVLTLKRALCALNLLILVGMTIAAQMVLDQIHPSCPIVLMYLPFLGTISTVATITLLIALATSHCEHTGATATKICWSFDVLCLILFVPYMAYWNLIGIHF